MLEIVARAGQARLGTYLTKSEKKLLTPMIFSSTSRGAVPHLTPDQLDPSVPVYLSLEDFLEKISESGTDTSHVPMANAPVSLRHLLCISETTPLVVGLRRSIPVQISKSNTDDRVTMVTCEGIKTLDIDLYHQLVQKSGADIALAVSDVANLSPGGTPGGNRRRKMVLRTQKWLEKAVKTEQLKTDLFAMQLPLIQDHQAEYINYVRGQADHHIQGIAVMRESMTTSLPIERETEETGNQQLVLRESIHLDLPRLMATGCQSPHDIIDAVAAGIDLIVSDVATHYSESGVALDFTFPPTANGVPGINLWDVRYKIDTSALVSHNKPVTTHHRAYIHHLLDAREMASWVILQKQNLAVLDAFMAGIHQAIVNGTFAQEAQAFVDVYGPRQVFVELKNESGKGPKQRGYTVGFKDLQVKARLANDYAESGLDV